ncbi:hypothetical protein QBC32DRAFT_35845 [Pseudoneurospora amorphoporcata]|uniref:Ecp2 effector protein domain-containing protein n=1 Tax=Pseudoneurospora amorphoporcata TaxID=241081 RepID=A0AAN6SE06_9PEZI|nr:hypothetical protein QBC32DRAFT_35845 [Pseudoneurospora amorphoporcata]
MVHFTHLSILFIPFVAVSLLHQVHAEGNQHFSFRRWVDDISGNPENALSPEEALQAYIDSAADMDDDALPATGSAGPEKRWDSQVVCKKVNRGKVLGAVYCIDILHAKGMVPCHTYPIAATGRQGERNIVQAWCVGNSMAVTPFEDLGKDETKYPTCETVARTAGVILDTCTSESDHTVAGWREKDLTGLGVGVRIYNGTYMGGED